MNKFSGTLTYSDKTPAPNAKVKLTVKGNSSINESTTTDKDGNWIISLKEDVNPNDVTILFSKSGYKSKEVTNPGPTEFFEELIDPKKGGSLELQSLFESGKWKVTSLSGEDKDVLDHELEDLFQFIKKYPTNIQIKIRSSESQVPNSDNEGGTRTNEFRNNPGSLAKARGESLKKYIEDEINKKIEADTGIQNKGNYRPIFNYTEEDITRVGDKPWERDNPEVEAENKLLKQQEGVSKSADLSKYKKDQYVAVDVALIRPPKDCASINLVFDVMYIGKGHVCNSATYQFTANGEILLRDDGADFASLNNDIPKYYYENKITRQGKPIIGYENIAIGYHQYMKSWEFEDRRRFKFLQEGDPFPINDLVPPTVKQIGGHRFNRFIIPSNLLKKLVAGKPDDEKIVKFKIGCINPSNYDGPYWDYDCHQGVGSFVVYRIDVKNNVMTVIKTSKILDGKTPGSRGQFIDLFEYNLCDDNISNLNPNVFSPEAIKSVVGDG